MPYEKELEPKLRVANRCNEIAAHVDSALTECAKEANPELFFQELEVNYRALCAQTAFVGELCRTNKMPARVIAEMRRMGEELGRKNYRASAGTQEDEKPSMLALPRKNLLDVNGRPIKTVH